VKKIEIMFGALIIHHHARTLEEAGIRGNLLCTACTVLTMPFGLLKGPLWIPRSGAMSFALWIHERGKANFIAKLVRRGSVF
jgi:hypothetical protein